MSTNIDALKSAFHAARETFDVADKAFNDALNARYGDKWSDRIADYSAGGVGVPADLRLLYSVVIAAAHAERAAHNSFTTALAMSEE